MMLFAGPHAGSKREVAGIKTDAAFAAGKAASV
jgi:hypothetical protein